MKGWIRLLTELKEGRRVRSRRAHGGFNRSELEELKGVEKVWVDWDYIYGGAQGFRSAQDGIKSCYGLEFK